MGGRGRNGLSLPASDWVTFLVDFCSGLFAGVGPRRFLWWASNSLLWWVRSELQREKTKKRAFSTELQ